MDKLREFWQSLKTKIQYWRRSTTRVSPLYIHFSDFFWCNRILAQLGYSVLPELYSDKKYRRAITVGAQVMSVLTLVFLALSFMRSVKIVTEGYNVFIAMENVTFTGIFLTILLKWCIILRQNYAKIMQIMEKLEEHYPQAGVDQLTFNTANYLRTIKGFSRAYAVFYGLQFIQFTSMPFLHQLYEYLMSEEIVWEHIIAMNLPFDTMRSAIYWPRYFIESWLLFVDTWIFYSTDLLFATLAHLVTMELNNLAAIVGEIDWDDEDEIGEEAAIKELKVLANIHQQLIEVTESLDKIFSPLLLVNVFAVMVALCTAAFLAVSGKIPYLLVKYSFPVVTIALQIFIHCHFGDRLSEASLRVANGAYNSAWYKASGKYRRMVLQVIVRAQREQKITGWKFVDINLETYCWIVCTAHSYFSFLSSVYTP